MWYVILCNDKEVIASKNREHCMYNTFKSNWCVLPLILGLETPGLLLYRCLLYSFLTNNPNYNHRFCTIQCVAIDYYSIKLRLHLRKAYVLLLAMLQCFTRKIVFTHIECTSIYVFSLGPSQSVGLVQVS